MSLPTGCPPSATSDAIMVLITAGLLRRGTHDELLKLKGTYYQLYTGKLESCPEKTDIFCRQSFICRQFFTAFWHCKWRSR